MIIEAVPNISEGRDAAVIAEAADAVRSVPGCALMHVESDPDHNRSVLSFLGEPEAVMEAAFRLARACVERIDLTRQQGVHPRMGAIDVLPLIPIRAATMDDCVEFSRALGDRLWRELALPVYLYEYAATAPHRKNLADVRRGQFEGLSEKMVLPGWAPDFGDRVPHQTAGAVAVGARNILVAFNINLDTPDVNIAKSIARAIRESSGGLPCVKALGLYLEKTGQAQVSINMVDYRVTPLHQVLDLVRAEAQRHGVTVANCEIIGLAPMDALAAAARHYMQLTDFDPQAQIIERHLLPE